MLQCSAPVPDAVWERLNTCFFATRPDVELRIYAHHSTTPCDLRIAGRLTNVRRFAADCLRTAKNVDAIAEIPALESLSVGIFDLRSFDFLERVPPTLTRLALGGTRSKAPALAPLSRFRSLTKLYLEGHSKDIEVIGGLPNLEQLTLRSITTASVGYLEPLERLWSLEVKLGGIKSFQGVEGKRSIKYLEFWQIRGLPDANVVSTLPGLQNLFLQSLNRVRAFSPVDHSVALRRVIVQNLRGLDDFTALERAPALEEFALIQGERQTPEQIVPVLRNRTVRRVSAHFGSDQKNARFAELRRESGKADDARWEPFQYR